MKNGVLMVSMHEWIGLLPRSKKAPRVSSNPSQTEGLSERSFYVCCVVCNEFSPGTQDFSHSPQTCMFGSIVDSKS